MSAADRALFRARENAPVGELAIAEQLSRVADALEAGLPMLERLSTPLEPIVTLAPDVDTASAVGELYVATREQARRLADADVAVSAPIVRVLLERLDRLER